MSWGAGSQGQMSPQPGLKGPRVNLNGSQTPMSMTTREPRARFSAGSQKVISFGTLVLASAQVSLTLDPFSLIPCCARGSG